MPKTPIAIRTPHSHDVLFGRGAGTNSHPGNQRFLQWIWELSVKYHGVARRDKNNVCQKVIDLVHLQDPPGRFLQQTGNGQERKWNVVDETESLLLLSKVGQAFRDLKRWDLRQNSNSSRISSPGLQAEECAGIGLPIQPSWHSYSRHQSAGGLRQPVLKRFNNRHPGAPYALSVAPEHPVGLRPYHRHVYNKHSSSSSSKRPRSSNRVDQEHAPRRRCLSWHAATNRQEAAAQQFDQYLLVSHKKESRQPSVGWLGQQALGRFNHRHPGAPNPISVAPESPARVTPYHRHVYNKRSSSAKRPWSSNRVDQEHALKRRRLSWHAAANQQAREQQFDHLLFSRNKECDMEIVCRHDDELNHVSVSIPAHKTILAKSSPVLETIFQVNPDCRTLNFAYPASVVQQVLVHVYHQRSLDNTTTSTGGAIPAEQVAQLLELTKKFQWMDLYKQVFHRAYQSLTMHNLKWIVLQAWKNNDAMKELCRAYIKNHAVPVLTAPQFTVLANKEPQIWNDIVRAAVSGTHQGLGDSR